MNEFDTQSHALASLAIQHFIYAGILTAVFAAVSVAYLVAMWHVAGRVSRGLGFLIHTVFLLWQSNVAFVAVVCLLVGSHHSERAGEMMQGWANAQFMVPSSAVLYGSVLLLSLGIVWGRARAQASATPASD